MQSLRNRNWSERGHISAASALRPDEWRKLLLWLGMVKVFRNSHFLGTLYSSTEFMDTEFAEDLVLVFLPKPGPSFIWKSCYHKYTISNSGGCGSVNVHWQLFKKLLPGLISQVPSV